MADKEDLVCRVRQIANGYLILGRSNGEPLPQEYFPDLEAVEKAMIGLLWTTFDGGLKDNEEIED